VYQKLFASVLAASCLVLAPAAAWAALPIAPPLALGQAQTAKSFQCELVTTHEYQAEGEAPSKEESRSRYYSSGSRLRIDNLDDRSVFIMHADKSVLFTYEGEGDTWFRVPLAAYTQVARQQAYSTPANRQAYQQGAKAKKPTTVTMQGEDGKPRKITFKPGAPETLDGKVCDVMTLVDDADKSELTTWTWREKGLVLKTRSKDSNTISTLVYRNYQEVETPGEMFLPPPEARVKELSVKAAKEELQRAFIDGIRDGAKEAVTDAVSDTIRNAIPIRLPW
jgi:hypothetical protein